jgi:hypothetical protein
MHFRPRLLYAGQVVLDGVEGELHEHQGPAGLPDLSGWLTVPVGGAVPAGTYELVLDTGRPVAVLVRYGVHLRFGPRDAHYAHFVAGGASLSQGRVPEGAGGAHPPPGPGQPHAAG